MPHRPFKELQDEFWRKQIERERGHENEPYDAEVAMERELEDDDFSWDPTDEL